MIWFLIFVGILIFAPMVLVVIGAGLLLIAIPFLVFFGVWGLTTYAIFQMAPNSGLLAIGIGFIAGIVAARFLVKKVAGEPMSRKTNPRRISN
jgi:hypothetical protein